MSDTELGAGGIIVNIGTALPLQRAQSSEGDRIKAIINVNCMRLLLSPATVTQ